MGQVTPLLKKGEELNKHNYRPVTVLPSLNNIYERLLSSQLCDFYQDILSDFTSAYRKYYSCAGDVFIKDDRIGGQCATKENWWLLCP